MNLTNSTFLYPKFKLLFNCADKTLHNVLFSGSVKVWEFSSGQEIKSFLEDGKEEDQSVVAIFCLSDQVS